MRAKLWTDGGSRGNPGLAAAGIVFQMDKALPIRRGWFLGTEMTNNEAEYWALLLGLRLARAYGADHITCMADSKLVVQQVLGFWKCKSENLRPILQEVQDELTGFDYWIIKHIPRDMNAEADRLANQAMDQVRP